jgi:hypothetical protein
MSGRPAIPAPRRRRALPLFLAMLASCRPSAGDGPPQAAALLPASWAVPVIDPCEILSRRAIETLAGSAVAEPRPGGTAVDGTACQYAGPGPFVITVGMMSTNAYESLRVDFGGDRVADVGLSAQLAGPDRLGDITLVAREQDAAVLVMISGTLPAAGPPRGQLAATIAREALARLNHPAPATRPATTGETGPPRPAGAVASSGDPT